MVATDETALINFLIANKDKASDGLGFKQSVWNAAAAHLQQVTKKVVQRLLESARPNGVGYVLVSWPADIHLT